MRIATIKSRELLERGLKYCPTCKKVLPLSEFSTMKVRGKISSHCRKCANSYAREHYHPKPKQIKYEKRKMALRDTLLNKKFGIGLDDYNKMDLAQGSKCLICGKTKEMNGKALAVDHNHKTGEVRALLCNNCNVCVGFLKDNPEVAYKIAKYLEER